MKGMVVSKYICNKKEKIISNFRFFKISGGGEDK